MTRDLDPTPDPTDEQLLRRFVQGDNDSLAALAARHEPGMLGLATGLLNGRRDLARDAVQDAWVRVIRYGATFDARSSFKTWVYRIVINRCHDLRASSSRTVQSFRIFGNGSEPLAAPADELGAGAENSALREAVDALTPASRLLLLLCYHRELSHDEAAAVLGIPTGTLKSRLHAALEALRAAMRKEKSA